MLALLNFGNIVCSIIKVISRKKQVVGTAGPKTRTTVTFTVQAGTQEFKMLCEFKFYW